MLNIVLLVAVVILLFLLSGVWPPDSPWAPWWQMPPDTIREMLRIAKIKKNAILYELGSGTGRGVIIAAKEYGVTAVGIEIDPLRYWISRWHVLWSGVGKKITLQRKNFFQISLDPATILLLYLTPNALKRLTPKFKKELRPGTILASYTYEVPLDLFNGKLQIVTQDKQKRIYIYKVKK